MQLSRVRLRSVARCALLWSNTKVFTYMYTYIQMGLDRRVFLCYFVHNQKFTGFQRITIIEQKKFKLNFRILKKTKTIKDWLCMMIPISLLTKSETSFYHYHREFIFKQFMTNNADLIIIKLLTNEDKYVIPWYYCLSIFIVLIRICDDCWGCTQSLC